MFKTLEYPEEQEECYYLQTEDEFENMELEEEKEDDIENLDTQQREQCCVVVHSSFESLVVNPTDQQSKPSLEKVPKL
ncbi:hypothetical protein, partial [Picosynechococcus sp. PCC 7002]|uniref:hypothetical protein n=1 Tax=Picosynechococcus sp. (strain ATCC 27264 / PCC 7002 / PR-6) TaxID=32049 RepID=UPI001C3CD8C6